MPEETKTLEIAVYRRGPNEQLENNNVNAVDVGELLQMLTEEPKHLASVREEEAGAVKLEVQRTHEYEILIELALIGGSIFLKGALTELGKGFGNWLAGEIGKLSTGSGAEIRAQGLATVKIDPSNGATSGPGIAQLLSECAEKNVRVQLIVEPGN